MGECIIARSSGVISNGGGGFITADAPPVLNPINPMDHTMTALQTFTLSVFVEENNVNCTYQWFMNNAPIPGATEIIYNFTPDNGTENITVYSLKCAVTNNKGTTYSREAIITVYSTRWYIIKNYTIVDETAKLSTQYGSTYVQISGTTISSSNNGNRSARLVSDMFSTYKNIIGASFDTNEYYNQIYPISASNTDYINFAVINNSGTEIDVSYFEPPVNLIEISIGSTVEGSKSYIKIKELYLE